MLGSHLRAAGITQEAIKDAFKKGGNCIVEYSNSFPGLLQYSKGYDHPFVGCRNYIRVTTHKDNFQILKDALKEHGAHGIVRENALDTVSFCIVADSLTVDNTGAIYAYTLSQTPPDEKDKTQATLRQALKDFHTDDITQLRPANRIKRKDRTMNAQDQNLLDISVEPRTRAGETEPKSIDITLSTVGINEPRKDGELVPDDVATFLHTHYPALAAMLDQYELSYLTQMRAKDEPNPTQMMLSVAVLGADRGYEGLINTRDMNRDQRLMDGAAALLADLKGLGA